MRWKNRRRSGNVQDRRGMRSPRGIAGGLGTLVVILVAMYFGVDPSFLLQSGGGGSSPPPPSAAPGNDDPLAAFVSVVLADTEDAWNGVFNEAGQRYEEPTLVLFTGSVRSACGTASSAVGPFYCPGDKQIYIDLAFFRELQNRLNAPGDFAQAYVVAHEVGHHVQNLLGISDQVHRQRRQSNEKDANALSVRQELQADCLAGVWANRTERAKQVLEEGDIEEGLNAASAIGDDRLQRESQGYVRPDSFTHGSSEQRVRWFRRGLDSGDMDACDSFSAASI